MALMSLKEYFEQRRKQMDAHVQGEHRWLGDVDSIAEVTYNAHAAPWYDQEQTPVLK